jgi:hypothetical protein
MAITPAPVTGSLQPCSWWIAPRSVTVPASSQSLTSRLVLPELGGKPSWTESNPRRAGLGTDGYDDRSSPKLQPSAKINFQKWHFLARRKTWCFPTTIHQQITRTSPQKTIRERSLFRKTPCKNALSPPTKNPPNYIKESARIPRHHRSDLHPARPRRHRHSPSLRPRRPSHRRTPFETETSTRSRPGPLRRNSRQHRPNPRRSRSHILPETQFVHLRRHSGNRRPRLPGPPRSPCPSMP